MELSKLKLEINKAYVNMCVNANKDCLECKYYNQKASCDISFAIDYLEERNMIKEEKI